MAGTGFLRTVNFGGFDKKDVLAYVDELNTKIYNLEGSISEKDKLLSERPEVSENSPEVYVEGKDKYEAIISENNAKISELMANNDTLKLQISMQESELEQLNSDLSKVTEEKKLLEEKLESSQNGQPAYAETTFDIGSVFIEAKHSADRIVAEAKNAARKMEDDSKKLSQQIVEEANNRAEKIIIDSQDKSSSMISTAKSDSDQLVAKANNEASSIMADAVAKKDIVVSQFDFITSDIEKLATCLNEIVSDGVLKLVDAKKIIEDASVVVKELSNINESEDNSTLEKKNSNITTVDALIDTLDEDELANKYFNSADDYNAETDLNSFFNDKSSDFVTLSDDANEPSPTYSIDIGNDDLANLTSEIEASVSQDVAEAYNEEDILGSWGDSQQNSGKKISLVEDFD